ncbi:VOC family protein [Nocardiopsis sp. NPDC057823]|uniref:VOC family protein n=1 Tax=Nocardiopsis sp. NPDC057823 TaxID=3346256 RepID=UPI00366B2653
MPVRMRPTAVTLDCADPLELAAFYSRATCLPLDPRSTADFAALEPGDGIALAFQRVDGYRPPRWPGQEVPQQIHLDFAVGDPDAAQAELLALGATAPAGQPNAERWRVLLDPAGHPFCLVRG